MASSTPTTEMAGGFRVRRRQVLIVVAVMVWVSAVLGPAAWAWDRATRAAPEADSGPTIGPARRVADHVAGRAPGAQEEPGIAFDGTNFLVVWGDDRNTGLMGTRVTPSGTILDPIGIVIASFASGFNPDPQVSFDGTNFLVVWRGETQVTNVYGIRVSPAGVVLGTAQRLMPSGSNQRELAVTHDGTNWIVAWSQHDSSGRWDIYGARVNPSGVPISALTISTALDDQTEPSIASNGAGNSLVVWSDERGGDIYGARLDATGGVLDPTGFPLTTQALVQHAPEVSFGGGNFLAVWEGPSAFFEAKLYGTRVTTGGTVLDTPNAPLVPGSVLQRQPALAFDGTNWLVTWLRGATGSTDLAGFRVSTTGAVVGTTIAISNAPEDQVDHALAAGGGHFLSAWTSGLDVVSKRITSGGTVLDGGGVVLSNGLNDQRFPAVAFDGTNFLVVWADDRPGPNGESTRPIYGARVRPDGTRLDGSGFLIAPEGWYPHVAFDGENYLVVWNRGGGGGVDVLATRVSPEGSVLDTPIVVAAGSDTFIDNAPLVSAGGGNFLVLYNWREAAQVSLRASRITPGGTNLDPGGIEIASVVSFTTELIPSSMTFNGTDDVVVWTDTSNGALMLQGARVSPQGTVRDPDGIPLGTGRSSGAASVGSDTLVAWSDDCDIQAIRIGGDGSVLGTVEVAGDPPRCDEAPAVAANGSSYLVAWKKEVSSVAANVMLARVNAAGTVQDPGGVVADTAPTTFYVAQPTVALSAGPSDEWGLVYVKADGNAGTAFLRTMSPK